MKASSFATCSLLVAANLATQDPIEAAIVDLASTERQASACTVLVRYGREAVAVLRPIVREADQRDPVQLSMALYVLGRLGRHAVAALPELLHAYQHGLQPEVRRQALWAIGQVGPFAAEPGPSRAACIAFVERHAAVDIDRSLAATVFHRLHLGPDPGDFALDALLDRGPQAAVAAAEALAASGGEHARRCEVALAKVAGMLEGCLAWEPYPWDVDRRLDGAVASLAVALHLAGRRDAVVARGLLLHWDPDVRREGLAALGDSASLSCLERRDVVWLLSDGDAAVRHLALGTVRGWGRGVAVALPSLAHEARAAADRAFAAACADCMKRWLAQEHAGDRSGAARIVAGALAALVEGRIDHVDVADRTERDCDLLVEFVHGCQSRNGGGLEAVVRFVQRNGLSFPSVVAAFVWCLGSSDPVAWHEAVNALTVLGPVVADEQPDIDVLLMRSTLRNGARFSLAPIAEAWIKAGRSASQQQLARALDSDRWYVVLRAAVEIVQRGDLPSREIGAAADRALQRPWRDVLVSQGEKWGELHGRGYSSVTRTADANAVHAALALVLLAADDDRWRQESVLRAVGEALGMPETGLAEQLVAAKAAGRLGELARQLEAFQSPPEITMARR